MKHLIRLRLGIAAAYASVMIPLTGAMVGYLYHSNSELMLKTAANDMSAATECVQRDFKAMFDPVRQVVSSTAELIRTDSSKITQVQGMGYFYRQLQAMPQVFSLYTGFAGKGDFYQIFHIPPSLRALGPWQKPLENDVEYAVRYIHDISGQRSDNYIFYGSWGDVRHVERSKATYDPRVRPWYKASMDSKDVVFSDAYVYSSSRLIGVTLSQRITTSSGVLVGVVGADVTLDSLSSFLQRTQVGEGGRVFILDEDLRLVGHKDPRMGIRMDDEKVRLLPAIEVKDFVTAEAVRQWQNRKVDDFEFPFDLDDRDYMASFSQMPIGGGRYWTIGVLVDKDEFIGPIRENSLKILFGGLLVMCLAAFAISRLSKMLTDPINAIVAQTDRLKMFDLDGDLNVSSHIQEVKQLTTAVETMTRSLRSFSVYVPRELVRAIVSGGPQANLSSRRQPMTVMMSDIAGYTAASEKEPPEKVVQLLNEYFECMTQEIHINRGIVDKYIGDAIMAIWNAPLYDPLHVENACRAVLACKARSDTLAEDFRTRGDAAYTTRFGVHTGDGVIGNVGSSDRMQYSAIGPMINLTSRLEGLNKVYGTHILVSEDVALQVMPQFLARCIDRVVPYGTTQAVMIYELIGERRLLEESGQLDSVERKCSLWLVGLQLYFDANWLEAIAAFGQFHAEFPDDPVVKVFIERCKAYQKSPPPENWGGAQHLREK